MHTDSLILALESLKAYCEKEKELRLGWIVVDTLSVDKMKFQAGAISILDTIIKKTLLNLKKAKNQEDISFEKND